MEIYSQQRVLREASVASETELRGTSRSPFSLHRGAAPREARVGSGQDLHLLGCCLQATGWLWCLPSGVPSAQGGATETSPLPTCEALGPARGWRMYTVPLLNAILLPGEGPALPRWRKNRERSISALPRPGLGLLPPEIPLASAGAVHTVETK